MYRRQWSALAPPGRPAASTLSPRPRYPYRPPSDTTYRPGSGTQTRPGYYRAGPPPTTGPRPASGPFRASTGTNRTGYGHPYARPGDRVRPPPLTSRTRAGPSPLASGPRRQGPDRKSCQICSFSQRHPEPKQQVYHYHFSSKHLRTTT